MTKSIKPKQWDFYSEVYSDKDRSQRLPGVDFAKIFAEIKEHDIKHVHLTITEIIDWDMAPMRGYLHGVVIKNFVSQFNDLASHPENTEHAKHRFTADEVKSYLKAKFLGFDKTGRGWDKYGTTLDLNKAISSVFEFVKFMTINKTLDDKLKLASSEDLTPEQYWDFIHDCENHYFELFNEMYNIQDRPERPV